MLLLVKIFIFELHKTQMIMKKIAYISFFLMVNFLFSQISDVKTEGDYNGDGKKEFYSSKKKQQLLSKCNCCFSLEFDVITQTMRAYAITHCLSN
jgi:hypothetical protein